MKIEPDGCSRLVKSMREVATELLGWNAGRCIAPIQFDQVNPPLCECISILLVVGPGPGKRMMTAIGAPVRVQAEFESQNMQLVDEGGHALWEALRVSFNFMRLIIADAPAIVQVDVLVSDVLHPKPLDGASDVEDLGRGAPIHAALVLRAPCIPAH